MNLPRTQFICAITPNPALDLGGIVNDFRPNEKSYVRNQTRSPGGNAINVARILKRLNIPVVATGFLGGGTGEEIKFLLDEEKVKSRFITIDGHSRISVTVSNLTNHKQTRLSFPGPKIRPVEKKQLFDLIKEERRTSLLVVGGSLPEGFGHRDLNRLVSIANERNVLSIVDCPADVMRGVLSAKPFMIKPNLEEFHALTGSNAHSINSVRKEARKLLDQVRIVCVSSVEGGALLVTRETSFFGRIPNVKIKSTVGAGDSMVGAMAAQLFCNNFSGETLLRWGLAASAATLSHSGTAMGTAREIRRLFNSTEVHLVL
jgi:1-phosphofructokinase family hexose kinase